ncbi:MAG: chorismate synthase [Proteiniphilum sp.]|nr:chorismate synthase [Proteiniphilum sp.]
MNTFGTIFRLTSFGESHGAAVGGVIDGCPPGLELDMEFIQSELDRRRPGQSHITTPRKEADKVEFLSGIFQNQTTGAPIGFMVRNENRQSSDYDNIREVFRPSHADFTYHEKYGIRDYRGGGRSSARETITRVVAGSVAKLCLRRLNMDIAAYTSQVGDITLENDYRIYDLSRAEDNLVRCPDPDVAERMIRLIQEVHSQGDTIGGTITCVIKGTPVGLGEPIFGKLHAMLGSAMLSINAVKGFEYGLGFDVVARGSKVNDAFYNDNGRLNTRTNYSGGIQAGISNGQDIYFRVAFKPVSTILREQETVDIHGNDMVIKAHGRHDPCVLPRAVPIVESMAAITLLDAYLLSKATSPLHP